MKTIRLFLIFRFYSIQIFLSLFLLSCDSVKSYDPPREFVQGGEELAGRFRTALDQSTIEIEQGHFLLDDELILEGKKEVTIRGKGLEKTILSFRNNNEIKNGIHVYNCQNVILEDLSLEDASELNLKVSFTDGIIIRRLKSGWTGLTNEKNGSYGINIVLSNNILIEDCEALGARDAGISILQSKDAEIKNNEVYWNVAGIQSGNSTNIKIQYNTVFENSGGIFIFELPGMIIDGEQIEIQSNEIIKNNRRNFASRRNLASIIPPGTGLLIMASRNINVNMNQIVNNRTLGLGIVSYLFARELKPDPDDHINVETGGGLPIDHPMDPDQDYDPYPGAINVGGNYISSRYLLPDIRNPIGKIFLWEFGVKPPHIVWDGLTPEGFILSDGRRNPAYRICIDENDDIRRVDLDFGNDFKNVSNNPEIFLCNQENNK